MKRVVLIVLVLTTLFLSCSCDSKNDQDPWNDYGRIIPWVRERRSEEDLKLIMGGNAARLLGLEGEAS